MDVDGNETTYDFPNQFNAFEGTFDGQNHSVTNYTDTNAVYNGNLDAYSALLGAVSGSIIKNLTIDNFNLTGIASSEAWPRTFTERLRSAV